MHSCSDKIAPIQCIQSKCKCGRCVCGGMNGCERVCECTCVYMLVHVRTCAYLLLSHTLALYTQPHPPPPPTPLPNPLPPPPHAPTPPQEYMRVHRVPQALRNRVIATLKLKYASRRLVDEAAMMRDVNPTLRTDIQMHVLGELVAKVPIFQACRCVFVFVCRVCLCRVMCVYVCSVGRTQMDQLYHVCI